MGACTFSAKGKGKTAQEAFTNAVKEAQYMHGHGGYSGTIAEKHEFVMITVPDGVSIREHVNDLIDEGDHRIDDKWGPAGCIDLGNDEYYFFGWASE